MYCKSVLFSRVVSSRGYSRDSTKKLLEFLADMPKVNSPRISEAQRQRQQISKKAEKYGPSCVYLQVLGSGARGAPNTLYLFTDQKRYLFNCGEQTQRLAHEHKVKLSRLDHIFVTSKTWRNIGGLPGLSLTLQDVGVPSLTLHGPEGLDELYNATSRFVIMKDMNVTMAKCSPLKDFEDNVMTVKYVVLKPNIELLKELNDPTPALKRQKISNSRDDMEKAYEQFIHDDTDYYKADARQTDQATTNTYVNERVKTPSPVKERAKSATSRTSTQSSPDRTQKAKSNKVVELLDDRRNSTAVCYICVLKKRLGTLDLAKCVERGVKPGPLLGELKSGRDVVLPDGTIVYSKDVKTPDDPGPVFIVLEVPEISYLREADFSSHFANGSNPEENIPAVVVHYTPPHVFHHKQYQDFIAKFGPSTRHLILNTQNSCLGSEAVHRTQHKLHLLDPDIFPLLKDVSIPSEWSVPTLPKDSAVRIKGVEELKNKIAMAQFQNILNMESSGHHTRSLIDSSSEDLQCTAGRTLTAVHLRPRKQLDRSAEPKLHIQDYIQETMNMDGFVSSLEQFRRQADNMRYVNGVSANEYPKVVFLGTGSCIPSKTRNTSAIVLRVDEYRSILLDCGEGTFGQLVRFYGPKRVNSFLRTLRAIYISHLHADHHIGLIGVLQARRQAFDEVNAEVAPDPIYLLAPGQIVTWLTIYDHHFEQICNDFNLIPNQNLVETDNKMSGPGLTSGILSQIGAKQIKTCYVPHCPNAFGVSVDIGPHRITYSGDTLPCKELIKLGENSNLLIHEATMEDELASEARIKMHCTTTQAIDVGKQMNATYTILTHFSQRYARLPRLNANILHDNTSVGIAFDNMQITMSDLHLLPHMYAPLQLMFAEHCVEMELKAAHRARQKLRASKAPPSNTDVATLPVPNVSAVPRVTSSKAVSEMMSYYRPAYKDSKSSRLRAKAWSITAGIAEPVVRPRKFRSRSIPQKPAPKTNITTLITSKPSLITATSFTPNPKPSQTSARSITPTPKPSQTSATSITPYPKSSTSATSITPISKPSQTSARSNTPNSKPSQTSATSITPYPKPSQTSATSITHTPKSAKSITPNPKPSHTSATFITSNPKPSQTTSTPNPKPSKTFKRETEASTLNVSRTSSATNDIGSYCSSLKSLNFIPKSLHSPPRSSNVAANNLNTILMCMHATPKSLNTTPKSSNASPKSSNNSTNSLNDSPTDLTETKKPDSVHSLPSVQQRRASLTPHFQQSLDTKPVLINNVKSHVRSSVTPMNSKLHINGSFPRGSSQVHTNSTASDKSYSKYRVQKSSSPQNGVKYLLSVSCDINLKNAKVRNSEVSPIHFSVSRSQDRAAAAAYNCDKQPLDVKPVVSSDGSAVSSWSTKSQGDRKSRIPIRITEKSHNKHSSQTRNDCKMKTNVSMSTHQPTSIPAYRLSSVNNRGFIPQLEDIKSSFMLLETRTQIFREIARKQATPVRAEKPKPVDEDERRNKIIEARKKFQSKQYRYEEKYDKIEGLNWISWK